MKFNNNSNNNSPPPIIDKRFPNIYNLTRAHFSIHEKELLNKGLKFCPTPKPTSPIEIEGAINELYRKILVVGFYADEEDSPPPQTSPDTLFQRKHQKKSTWQPQRSEVLPEILHFADDLKNLLQETPRRNTRNRENLTKRQRYALKKLKKRKDIIIKPADKGAGIVILTPEQYETEAYRQIKDERYYTPATSSLPEIQEKIRRLCNKYIHEGTLPKKSGLHIIQNQPRPARFYLLPKIHKSIQNPPGRPIMSGNKHPTEKLSEYVDFHLKPHVPKIKSYLKDTSHFLEIIKDVTLPPNAKLVTFDVSSLYTNIQHKDGTAAIYEFMKSYTDERTAMMLKEMTTTILENNLFEFNSTLYTQVSGTAMGSKFAPNYANIRMDQFEKTHLKNAPIKPLLWKRYIDDVFTVFVASEEEIKIFEEWLNSLDPHLKFTSEYNKNGIPFLDTFCSIKDNKIVTRPYTKPTDTKQYLHPTSCHPPHTIKSIPYSQALRIQRICSEKDDLENELRNLSGFFKNRDYNMEDVNSALQKVKENKTSEKPTNDLPNVVMILPYHPTNPLMQKTISQTWEKHKNHIQGFINKPIIAYKRPANLKDLLVRALHGKTAIVPKIQPTALINRSIRTYDKNQLKAPIKHVLFKCECGQEIHEFNNLEEAIRSTQYRAYFEAHEDCASLNIMPVDVTYNVKIKCNECPFNQEIFSNKRKDRICKEVYNCVMTTQKGLYNVSTNTSNCTCSTCKYKWNAKYVEDPRGTKYRISPPQCNTKNAIYIIHCTRCSTNYVGMTVNLRQRLSQHFSSINHHKSTSISDHFNTPGHNPNFHLKIAILDQNISNRLDLRMREGFWIHLLQTTTRGINRREESSSIIDFQVLSIANHYRHSKSCFPYLLFTTEKMATMHLQTFRRVILPKRRHRKSIAAARSTALPT